MRTLWKALHDYFPDPRLQQLFGRYATYNGSNPFLAPATLAVIAHVENAFGIFGCKGGIVRLGEALERCARELGVELRTSTPVVGFRVHRGDRVVGVELESGALDADLVVANCDVAQAYEFLRGPRHMDKRIDAYAREDLSLSAFLWLGVGPPPPIDLVQHNVFFSTDYRREFAELETDRRPPEDPTVYLCQEGDGAYMFLSNAPPLDPRSRTDWAKEAPRARDRIRQVLARHGWDLELPAEATVSPSEFAELFPRSKGAIYGL